MKIQKYKKETSLQWNEFNKSSKNGLFMFDRNYMDYHSNRFKDNSLMFYDDDKLLALLPCNINKNVLYSHQGLTFGGFITNDSMKQSTMLECFSVLKDYMRKHSIDRFIYKSIPYIYHKKPSQEDVYALFINDAYLFRVDCSTTIDLQNICKMQKGRKAQISKAKRELVQIEKSLDYENFVKLLNDVLLNRHNVKAVHNAEELALLHSRFPQNIQLFVAKQGEKLLAATLLFIYENVVHTQYLAVNDKGREIGALDLLIKTLIDKFSGDKKYFDLHTPLPSPTSPPPEYKPHRGGAPNSTLFCFLLYFYITKSTNLSAFYKKSQHDSFINQFNSHYLLLYRLKKIKNVAYNISISRTTNKEVS